MTEDGQVSDETKDTWAIVEIMGHSRFAGRVSQDTSLGVALLRVDVPAVGEAQAFTKLFGSAAIFGVTPCTEATAREAAAEFRARPVSLFHVDHQPRLPFQEAEDWDEGDD